MQPNTPQAIALASPVENAILTGTRGWGKDFLEYFMMARKAAACAGRRILFSRLTDQALRGPWTAFQQFLRDSGIPYTANEANREIKLYDCTVVFGPNPTEAYYNATWRGSSFVMIVLSEFSSADAQQQLKLVSCLRDAQYPTSLVIDGNALGPSAFLLNKWAILRAADLPLGTPFVIPELGNMEFVNFHCSYRDNEYIDPIKYRAILAASCGGEDTLQFRRENDGIYGLAEGSLYVYDDRARVCMPTGVDWNDYPEFHVVLAIDHGSTSPFAGVFLAEATRDCIGPDGFPYPMGSRIVISAVTSALKESGWVKANPHTIAMCANIVLEEWQYLSSGPLPKLAVIDSQVAQFHGAEGGALLKEWQSYIPTLKPVVKSPVANGCAQIIELLAGSDLAQQDYRPSAFACLGVKTMVQTLGCPRVHAGLYVDTRRAEYLDHILGNLDAHTDGERPGPRSRGLLHGHDALRYALAPRGSSTTFSRHTKRTKPTTQSETYDIDSKRYGPSGRGGLPPMSSTQLDLAEVRNGGFKREQLKNGYFDSAAGKARAQGEARPLTLPPKINRS
jgi:hypothetical protein